MTDSVRKYQSFQENMKRLRGEMERMLYAAEVACNSGKHYEECVGDCPFVMTTDACAVLQMRKLFGDHFEQHDPTEVIR